MAGGKAIYVGTGPYTFLWIGGIQHHPEDFLPVATALAGTLRSLLVPREVDPHIDVRSPEWSESLLQLYLEYADEHACVGVVGHSRGCRYALDLLTASRGLRFAILICVPGRKPDYTKIARCRLPPRRTDTRTEEMLRPLVPDVDTLTYAAFIDRHALYERQHGQPDPSIVPEFRRLRVEPPVSRRLEDVDTATLLVIHAVLDPWSCDVRETKNVRVCRLEDAGHYPHVTRPEEVARVVKQWIEESVERCSWTAL